MDDVGNSKTKKVAKKNAVDYQGDVYRVINECMDRYELKVMAKNNGIKYESIIYLSVRLGDGGTPIFMDARESLMVPGSN